MTIAFQRIKTSIWCPARLFLATSVMLSGMLAPQIASAATITNIFTAVVDLSFFGGDGTDEFQLTYTFDNGLTNQSASPGLGRYGPITGNIRADSLGFDFDFNAGNTSNTNIAIANDAVIVFPAPATLDIFSINIATGNIVFGDELISSFNLSLIDEDASVFSSIALVSGTAFFSEIDTIRLGFGTPIFPGSTQSGPGSFVDLTGPATLVSGVSAVPVPAALPLFASGLGLLGLLGWMRRRKIAV